MKFLFKILIRIILIFLAPILILLAAIIWILYPFLGALEIPIRFIFTGKISSNFIERTFYYIEDYVKICMKLLRKHGILS